MYRGHQQKRGTGTASIYNDSSVDHVQHPLGYPLTFSFSLPRIYLSAICCDDLCTLRSCLLSAVRGQPLVRDGTSRRVLLRPRYIIKEDIQQKSESWTYNTAKSIPLYDIILS